MKKVLIATHGKMASGIKRTAELLLGEMVDITTIDAYVEPDVDIEKQMEEFFERKEPEEQVFVFTDLQGGSVNQKLLPYSADANVILITGFNLPMLLQILMAEEPVSRSEIEEYLQEARQEMKMVSLAVPEEEKHNEAVKEERMEKKEQETVSYTNSGAKIAALRVDDRLIHGQVAMTWTKQLKVQGIIVANDAAAEDPTQKMALKMAAPSGIKVLVKPVNEVIRVLNHPKAAHMRILVLTRTIKDAVAIRENVGEIEFLNVGNVGRFDGIDVSEKKILTSTIMLTAQEIESLRQLAALDPKACIQQVPNDEKKLVKDMIEKLG